MSTSSKFKKQLIVNIPIGYWIVSRQNLRRFCGWLWKRFGFWILAGLLLGAEPWLDVMVHVTLGWIGLMCVYEIGYWRNDRVAKYESEDGVERNSHEFVKPLIFIFSRLFLFAICFSWLRYEGRENGYLEVNLLILLIFIIHNSIKPHKRLTSFLLLGMLYMTVPLFPVFSSATCTCQSWYLSYILVVCIYHIFPEGWFYFRRKVQEGSLDEKNKPLNLYFGLSMLLPCFFIGGMSRSWVVPVLATYQALVRILIIFANRFMQIKK